MIQNLVDVLFLVYERAARQRRSITRKGASPPPLVSPIKQNCNWQPAAAHLSWDLSFMTRLDLHRTVIVGSLVALLWCLSPATTQYAGVHVFSIVMLALPSNPPSPLSVSLRTVVGHLVKYRWWQSKGQIRSCGRGW